MRLRHKQTNCVCIVCGTRFIASSTRARTCTEVCRKRLSRQRKRDLLATPHCASGQPSLAGVAATVDVTSFMRSRPRDIGPRAMPLSPIERFLRLAAPQASAMH